MSKKEEGQEFGLFKKEIRRRCRLEGAFRLISLRLGKPEGYISNLLSGETTFSLPFLYEMCREFSWSPGELCDVGNKIPFTDPVALLMSRRERPQLPSCEFLDGLKPRCTELLACAVENAAVASELPVLEALEEKRFGDCRAAQDAAEELAFRIAYSLEGSEGAKPRKQIGELAATVALWATIQRQRGFRDLAINGYALAFPLAKASRDSWALGTCYQRAAYLLRDLDRPDLGYGFVREAIVHFSATENQLYAWRCHVDLGCMLSSCKSYEESNAAYEVALERLPGSDWRFRVGALQGLGANAQAQKMPERARDFLASAAAECRQEDLYVAHIKWARAKAELDLGSDSGCLEYFCEAEALFVRFGNSGDLALVCVDHAEALLRLKRRAQLIPLLTDVAGWLSKLRANPILCKAFGRAVDLVRLERIGLADFEGLRQEIRAAWKRGEVA